MSHWLNTGGSYAERTVASLHSLTERERRRRDPNLREKFCVDRVDSEPATT